MQIPDWNSILEKLDVYFSKGDGTRLSKKALNYQDFVEYMKNNPSGYGYVHISGPGIKRNAKIGFGQARFFSEIPTEGSWTIEKLCEKATAPGVTTKNWIDEFVEINIVYEETKTASEAAQKGLYKIEQISLGLRLQPRVT
jgi:hypothetical protein